MLVQYVPMFLQVFRYEHHRCSQVSWFRVFSNASENVQYRFNVQQCFKWMLWTFRQTRMRNRRSFSNNKRGTNSNKAEDEPSTEQQRLIHCPRIALFVRFVFATCVRLNVQRKLRSSKLTKSQLPIVVHESVYTESRSVFPGRWVTYSGAHCEIRHNVGHSTIDHCARSIA